jgi:hypothetical protein
VYQKESTIPAKADLVAAIWNGSSGKCNAPRVKPRRFFVLGVSEINARHLGALVCRCHLYMEVFRIAGQDLGKIINCGSHVLSRPVSMLLTFASRQT